MMTTSSPSHANSEPVSIEVHLFACGHGDTILLRLPARKWVLIDCHLPKYDGTFDRFLDYLRENDVERLDWVFLTHPDTDHFLGMTDVLDHFTKEGRSLGWWLYGGLSAQDVRSLMWPDEMTRRRYTKLRDHVKRLANGGLIRRARVDENSRETSPEGYRGRVELFPIAPSEETLSTTAEHDLESLGKDRKAQVQSNALSVVLCLSIKDSQGNCNVLLCGDAGPGQLTAALTTWRERAQEFKRPESFDVVKVSHHGSEASHSPEVCEARRQDRDPCVAAISAGTRDVLPDREVMRDYMTAGWQVMLTTRPRAAPRHDRPMGLANRAHRPDFTISTHNIKISWVSGGKLERGPREAIVATGDLNLYQTARETAPK